MKYRCCYPEWENQERPCDKPNKNIECCDCMYAQLEEDWE